MISLRHAVCHGFREFRGAEMCHVFLVPGCYLTTAGATCEAISKKGEA